MAMETRKLQQVGGGTYTVSVPKEWAVEHGLEAGSEIHLYAHADGSIVVRSSEKDGGNLDAVRVDVDGHPPALITRTLRAAHATGFKTVTLRPREPFTDEQRRAARRTKRHLVGTEIVVERDDEIVLRNLLDASDVSVRQSVVQLQFVALSTHRRATAAFADAEGVDHDRLRERAEEADRLYGMITRHFSRSQISMEEVDRLGVSRSELFDYYATARELRRVADLGVTIGRATELLSKPLSDDLATGYGRAADAAERVVDSGATAVLERFDVARANSVFDRCDEAIAAVDEVDRAAFDESKGTVDASPNDARALTRALDALARTAERGGAIAEVAVRAATREDRR